MKKKIWSVLLIAVICISTLCACGNSAANTKAIITTNDGETVEISSKELCDIYDENQAKYSEKYQTATAKVTGTVKSVESYLQSFGTKNQSVYEVELKEGWSVTVLSEFHEEVIDLSEGDKVTITSNIQLARIGLIEMQNIGQKDGWYDGTIIEIVNE